MRYFPTRESTGQGLTDAWPANDRRLDRGYDRLLAITRSATTTEVVDASATGGGGQPATVITTTSDSPAVDLEELSSFPGSGAEIDVARNAPERVAG